MTMSKSHTVRRSADTLKIEPDQWTPFLAQFTRENRGAHATLEVLGPEVGYQVQTDDRPFDGITAYIKDGERAIWITFGSKPEEHFTHGVQEATVIWVVPPAGARGAALEIEAQDGTRTVLQLTTPEAYALPPADSR
jgi:hypothetical protein